MTAPFALDWPYKPPLPRDMGMGIAIVGAGGIVRSAHLPACRLAGFRVVGVYDADRSRAEALAREPAAGAARACRRRRLLRRFGWKIVERGRGREPRVLFQGVSLSSACKKFRTGGAAMARMGDSGSEFPLFRRVRWKEVK